MEASGALEGAPYRVEWSELPAQHLLEGAIAGTRPIAPAFDTSFDRPAG